MNAIPMPTLGWTEEPSAITRQYLVAVPLLAHLGRTAAALTLSSRAARLLAADLIVAADEADQEADRATLLDGIDSGDLDLDGNAVPWSTYRAA